MDRLGFERFEEAGPPLVVDDSSDRNWPFHLTAFDIFDHSQSQYLALVVTFHRRYLPQLPSCVTQGMFWLSKLTRDLLKFFSLFERGVWRSLNRHISGNSLLKITRFSGQISTHETARTLSLIKSNLSSNNVNTSNSDPTSAILKER